MAERDNHAVKLGGALRYLGLGYVFSPEIGAATDPVKADCCIPAPNVLEFDPDGSDALEDLDAGRRRLTVTADMVRRVIN